ncbi:MAG TPA: phosphatase PAP2 family protein [Vicinamibacteria bacterium]|jgi:undecaprenyl-diphosphatase
MHGLLAYVTASDLRVCERVHAWPPPRWFRAWMVGATRFADGWGWLALAVGLILAAPGGWRAVGAGSIASVLASGLLVTLKRRFRRERPCDVLPPVFFRVKAPDRFSFPSGHTMNAFAVCTVLALQYPLGLPLLAFLAVSVGASRVALGLHYVSDVAAGAVLGAGVGALAHAVLFA